MSEALTEVNNYDGSVIVPQGSDIRNAASVRTAFQSLANRTKYLFSRLLARDATTGNVSMLGGTQNNLTVGGDLAASGNTQLATATSFGLHTFANGISVLFGTFSVTAGGSIGNCKVSGVLDMGTTGVTKFRQIAAPDFNQTFSIADADTVIIPISGITGSHNYQFSAAGGASNGMRIRILNWDSAHTHTIKKSDGGTVAVIPAATIVSSIGYPGFVELEWHNPNGSGSGGDWQPTQRQFA
jgi:hypothetical protein